MLTQECANMGVYARLAVQITQGSVQQLKTGEPLIQAASVNGSTLQDHVSGSALKQEQLP